MTDAGVTWTDERVELLKKLWIRRFEREPDRRRDRRRDPQCGDRQGSPPRPVGPRQGRQACRLAAATREGHPAPSAPAPIPPQARTGQRGDRPGPAAGVEPVDRGAGVFAEDDRRSHVRARDHHGSARVHVPLAHGRPDQAGIPLLRRPFGHGPALLHPPRPHRLSAGGRPQARAAASPALRIPGASAIAGRPRTHGAAFMFRRRGATHGLSSACSSRAKVSSKE